MSHFVRFYFLQHVLCLKEDTGYSLNHCVHWYKFLVWSIKLPPRHCIVYFGSNYIIVVAPFIVSHRNFLCIKFADNRYQGTHEWFLKKKLSFRWSRASKPTLRQVHTKMSGNYFHRGISRLRAEELLLSAKEDGSFLVRDSETLQGAYVLCLL